MRVQRPRRKWCALIIAGCLAPLAPAHAQEPNVLAGHRACPGYNLQNYGSIEHPFPGEHGIRLRIGCQTAFRQYETYLREPTRSNYEAFLAAADVVKNYHAQNRFGSMQATAPQPLSPVAQELLAKAEEKQRQAIGKSVARHGASELRISEPDARKVLTYFFGKAPTVLEDNDRRFAQALILESAEWSSKASYIEALFRSAVSPAAEPSDVVEAIAEQLIEDLGRSGSLAEALKSPNYLIVVNQIRANWRTAWDERLQNGDSGMLLR